MSFRQLIPTLNRVLIRRFEAVNKTQSGIILQQAEKNSYGVVVEVGSGDYNAQGVKIPVSVQKGDKVLLPEYGGQKVELNKEELYLYRDSDILAICKE